MLFWIRIHSSCKRLFITKLKPMNKVRLHEVIFMNLQWCVHELENNFISKMWESYSWSDSCSSISLSVKIILCFLNWIIQFWQSFHQIVKSTLLLLPTLIFLAQEKTCRYGECRNIHKNEINFVYLHVLVFQK